MIPTKTRGWPRWLFRAAISAETLLVFTQAGLAGGFLAGHYGFLDLHKANATYTGVTTLVVVVCAVLLWRPGGGPAWPIFVSAGLFAAEAGQIVLGYGRVLAVHIPLGVAITASIVVLAIWAWRDVE